MIPRKALSQHIAVVGKTGSGKSSAVRVSVEDLLDRGERVCIVDPVGVWYGLRSNASGKRGGYPVAIFGGQRGDLPLPPAHGETIAEVVGTTATPCVIDTSDMRTKDRTIFFRDFADALMRKNSGPLHLVIDEAHLFMPQGKVASPQAGEMLAAANNMVSGGRARGLRIIMVTQRPAKLHKDSLTQAETLVAMRLIAPQDRKAVQAWIEDNADEDKAAQILSSLAELPTGEGWIWAPQLKMLERERFLMFKTFDSFSAPDGRSRKAKFSEIDREALAAKLTKVSAVALADDPKQLRAKIVELQRQVKQQEHYRAAPNHHEIEKAGKQARQAGYREGCEFGYAKGVAEVRAAVEKALKIKPGVKFEGLHVPKGAQVKVSYGPDKALHQVSVTTPPKPAAPRQSGDGVMTGPEQRILDALMWLESTTGKPQQPQAAVAFLAKYTVTGGAYQNPRGKLKQRGLIEYVGGDLRLTDAGREQANAPDHALTSQELQSRVMSVLPGPERRILNPIIAAWPNTISQEDVARAANYAVSGGAYQNPRGRLKVLGLIEYHGGALRASDVLFPT